MKKLYLLPYNEQDVQFSFDENILKELINTVTGLPHNQIFTIEVEDDFANKLDNPPILSNPYPSDVPNKYYEEVEKFIDNRPEWHHTEEARMYVIFNIDKKCYWSPSGNNLNTYHKNQPAHFFNEAIKVPLDRESYIKLMGYFKCVCENF